MTTSPEASLVLVTGASGFLGAHCVARLLEQGHRVRGTLRNLALEPELRAALSQWANTPADKLEFVRADLLSDAGWDKATAGCDYVLHVAAPYPMAMPKDPNDLIIPMREGTLRVLRAAESAGVRRTVMTSSLAAVGYGHRDNSRTLDESVWTNLDGNITSYIRGKTLAEQAAWEFARGHSLDLCVLNPGFIMGPSVDGCSFSTSGNLIRNMLLGKYPGAAHLQFWIADVRDIAAAHVLAMTSPLAAGRRYIATSEPMWMKEIAQTLNDHLAGRGYHVPTLTIPDFAYRIAARFDSGLRTSEANLSVEWHYDGRRLRDELGWQPRGAAETVCATADSLIAYGLV